MKSISCGGQSYYFSFSFQVPLYPSSLKQSKSVCLFLYLLKDRWVFFFNLLVEVGSRKSNRFRSKIGRCHWSSQFLLTDAKSDVLWVTVFFSHDKTLLPVTSYKFEKSIHVPWKELFKNATFTLSSVSNFEFLTCIMQYVV